jgi:hypothetical protein
MGWLRRNRLVLISILLLSTFLIPPVAITYVNNGNYLNIIAIAKADLKNTISQNYTVIENTNPKNGYNETYALDLQQFLTNCRLWGVKEVYTAETDGYIAYDDSLMRSCIYFSDPFSVKTADGKDYCLTTVLGFPFDEYTWRNPFSGSKTSLGWVVIRLTPG